MAEQYPSYVRGKLDVSIEEIQTNNNILYVGSVSSVSSGTLTTIVTVPANGLKFITKILGSAMESGRWEVYVDTVLKMIKRTVDRSVDFDFPTPLRIPATSVVDVKFLHNGPGTGVDADASVLGYAVV